MRHCHGYCCFCALVEGLSRAFLRQQEAERQNMRGLIETLPRGNDRLCFFTGWRRNVLLPISLYMVDQDCLTFHCFIQVGAGMSYFPLLYTGWTWNALLPIILHRVDLECLTSHCLTQGWPGMSYFPSLYTGWTWNVLLPISLHRVDQERLTFCMTLKMSKPEMQSFTTFPDAGSKLINKWQCVRLTILDWYELRPVSTGNKIPVSRTWAMRVTK